MRAFALYNDVIKGGVSLLVEGVDKAHFLDIDLTMQESIGDLKTVEAVVTAVSKFPKEYPSLKFVKGTVYGGVKRGEDARSAEQMDNTFGIRQTGYVLNKPKKIVEVQFESS